MLARTYYELRIEASVCGADIACMLLSIRLSPRPKLRRAGACLLTNRSVTLDGRGRLQPCGLDDKTAVRMS